MEMEMEIYKSDLDHLKKQTFTLNLLKTDW